VSGFHDFVPQHNNDYACVTPASCLEAKPKGMYQNIKVNYRIAESYQIVPTTRFAAVYYASLRRLLQNLGLKANYLFPLSKKIGYYNDYCKVHYLIIRRIYYGTVFSGV
jgi:hypothetical protein